jgi:cystathionine beta-lyase
MNPLEQYTLEELRSRTSEKWRNYPEDVLPLWVAEMDVMLPRPLIDELAKTIKMGDVGYLSKAGFERYATAFCDFTERHWHWKHDPAHIADVPDVVQGCCRVIDTWLQHDAANSVIVSTPIYPPFINKYSSGYRLVDVPLTATDYRLDIPALEAAFADATTGQKRAAYALCNPNNPTGTVHTVEELRELARISEEYNVLVVADEIHGPLVTARNFSCDGHSNAQCTNPAEHGKHSAFVPYLSIPEARFAVTVTSASKAYSIPGMKAALTIPSAHPSGDAQNLIWNSGNFGKATSEHIGALAQTICLEKCDDWLYHLVQGIRNNLAYFETLAAEYFPKAKWTSPSGTYFEWVDFSAYNLAQSPSKHFLDKAKVAFNPGKTFATPLQMNWSGLPSNPNEQAVTTPYDSFVRMNLATSQEIIRMALERVGESLHDKSH